MLATEQKQQYEDRGILHLHGAIDARTAGELEDFVWQSLFELHGICRDDPGTWNVDAPWVGLNKYKDAAIFAAIGTEQLFSTIDGLLDGQRWKKPRNWGGFLVNVPNAEPSEWSIPEGYWHVDFHFTYDPTTAFGIRVFTLLSALGPRGDGTLVVPGSHRLVARFVGGLTSEGRTLKFATLRDRFMASDAWFRRLTQTGEPPADRIRFFMEQETMVDGVPLRVEQLCGQPGDVVLMHPWLVHAPSPNCGPRPRFMLAKDIFATAQRTTDRVDSTAP